MDTDLTKINPFDFDTKVQQFSDFAKTQNASKEQIDRISGKLQSAYKDANGGSAGSSGVLGTGFGSKSVDEAVAGAGTTPNAYRIEESNSGFIKPLSPLLPNQTRWMGIPKTIPNALGDLGNVAGGLVSAALTPINTIEDMYHNPAALAGPVATNLLSGTGNAIGDLLQGNFSKAGIDFLSGADKAFTGFVDHPILSLPFFHMLGDLSDMAGITKAKAEIDPTTGLPKPPVTLKSDVQDKVGSIKKVFEDPKASAMNIAQQFMAPFKSLMPKATGDAAANIIANRVSTTLGQISNIDELNAAMEARPDFNAKTRQIDDALNTLEKNKEQAANDLDTAHKEDTALAKGIISTNTMNPDAVQGMIGTKIDTINKANTAGYENLKAPDGSRIPVTSTRPLADALQDFITKNGNMLDPKTMDVINDKVFLLKVQEMSAKGMSLQDIYKDFQKNNPDQMELFSKYPANFLKEPLTADQLKIVRDTIAQQIQKGVAPKLQATALKLYGDATRGAFGDMLSNSVDSVNPNGAASVRASDTAFKNLIETKEKYGIGDDGSFSDKKVEANWNDFRKDFPDAAKAYGQMKASQIVRDSIDISKTGIESINYSKLNSGLQEESSFIPTDIYSQIQSIIHKSYTDQALHDQLADKIDRTSQVLKDKLSETKTNEKISPSDPEEFEKSVYGIKTYKEMNDISKTSGIAPDQLGNIFIGKSIMKNFGENADISKLNTEQILTGAKGLLTDYDSLGGETSKTQSIKNEMFKDRNADVEKIREQVQRAEQAQKQGNRQIGQNVANAILGSVIGIWHSFTGAGMIAKSLRDIIKPRITEDKSADTVRSSFKSGAKKTAKLAVPIANTQQKNQ